MTEDEAGVLSLCSGIGGLELGLNLATGGRTRVVCYCERDAYAAATLVARMEEQTLCDAPIWDSLESFPTGTWRREVDVVTAGFPCQPWSQAGEQRGKDDERWIWSEIADIIRGTEPSVVFLENVPGLRRGGLRPVLHDLAEMGYDAEWGVVGAGCVGAPHKRDRLFILAFCPSSGERLLGSLLDETRGTEGESGGSVLRCGGGSQDGGAEATVGGRSGDVADGDGGNRSENQDGPDTQADGRDESSGGSPNMADAAQERGERSGEPGSGGRGEHPDPSRVVGDAGGAGPQGRQPGSRRPHELPPWPPGPEEQSHWRRVLQREPSVEPAVRRMAPRVPYWMEQPPLQGRTERLRGLGNAVVPIQAAVAFTVLGNRAREDVDVFRTKTLEEFA